jgi:hypothetical protein
MCGSVGTCSRAYRRVRVFRDAAVCWRLLGREPVGLGVDREAAGLDAAGAPVDGQEGGKPVP